ncbi:Cytochrome oxidase complex assembly protein 1 [Rubripirellula lacrimiformis]|uniref:Cytochrome oxidase complex assembly protein 1 n=1 Tax=Rubripirellula lacrimiformis TaxID=1930273 RepID=A0A517NL52_9BACT|nr:cytochrome c oxidase assembly factor Coa1 family protein [Rubripirellula lacrimiformis]QDT07867.1 Cytochrome oxidase complex assembly protein 1 [Rubripirellula lacrimiformis]
MSVDQMSPSSPETMAQPVPPKSRTGCLLMGIGGGCLVAILICGGLAATGVISVFALLKSSQPYTESLQRAQQNVELQQQIGTPIEPSMLVNGNVNLNNDDGEANLNYSVHGPNGSAQVKVVATKTDGNWQYQQMQVTPDQTKTPIDLATPNEP